MPASEILEQHEGPPSALAFMARAFVPSPGLGRNGRFPALIERWTDLRIDPAHLAAFRGATGLDSDDDDLPTLYPHVFGFRLQMALLTHRAFPLPLWSALQVRNRLVRHAPFGVGERFVLETRVAGSVVRANGVEVALRSRLCRGARCVWESEVVYLYRGRFGAPSSEEAPRPVDVATAPVVGRFGVPRSGGVAFGRLTGDYNGIHLFPAYARRFGFRDAFSHPQRIAGMCLARLPLPSAPEQTIELFLRGPFFYGATAVLRAVAVDHGVAFGASLEGDDRVALAGRVLPGDAVPREG